MDFFPMALRNRISALTLCVGKTIYLVCALICDSVCVLVRACRADRRYRDCCESAKIFTIGPILGFPLVLLLT